MNDFDSDLNEIQEEAEKLVALLKDRQPGLFTWNMMVLRRIKNIAKWGEPEAPEEKIEPRI